MSRRGDVTRSTIHEPSFDTDVGCLEAKKAVSRVFPPTGSYEYACDARERILLPWFVSLPHRLSRIDLDATNGILDGFVAELCRLIQRRSDLDAKATNNEAVFLDTASMKKLLDRLTVVCGLLGVMQSTHTSPNAHHNGFKATVDDMNRYQPPPQHPTLSRIFARPSIGHASLHALLVTQWAPCAAAADPSSCILPSDADFSMSDVECSTCNSIAETPLLVQCGSGGCRVCATCAVRCILNGLRVSSISGERLCFCCGGSFSSITSDDVAAQRIQRLKFRCACDTVVDRSALHDHVSVCPCMPVVCMCCKRFVIRESIETHLETCTAKVRCALCTAWFHVASIAQHTIGCVSACVDVDAERTNGDSDDANSQHEQPDEERGRRKRRRLPASQSASETRRTRSRRQ